MNETGSPSAPMFFDKVHDEFLSKLHDSFMEQYGIDMCNIRIESFKIINQELAANISKQVLTTTQTTSQLANLAGQTEIATAEQKRNAEVARIKAEGESVRLRTENDAKNRAVTDTAKSDADAQLVRARAEAQALEIKVLFFIFF
jgi:regulator of protease activity HflC (stomatin/prohibitin superfamily)